MLNINVLKTELADPLYAEALKKGSAKDLLNLLNTEDPTSLRIWKDYVSSSDILNVIATDLLNMTPVQQGAIQVVLALDNVNLSDPDILNIFSSSLTPNTFTKLENLGKRFQNKLEMIGAGVNFLSHLELVKFVTENIPTSNWALMKAANDLHRSIELNPDVSNDNKKRSLLDLRSSIENIGV